MTLLPAHREELRCRRLRMVTAPPPGALATRLVVTAPVKVGASAKFTVIGPLPPAVRQVT